MKLSLLIPVYDEAENLKELYAEIKQALENKYQFEIIFVDDGSKDESGKILTGLAGKDKRVKVVVLSRNFGQTAALAAGIETAKGELIITMDSDRQNDPADIDKLVAALDKETDIVSGWRQDRQDPLLRTWFSRVANRLINRISGTNIHDTGCSLKVYRRQCFQGIKLYGEMHRFIPALLVEQGFRVKEVKVNHRPRLKGKSHYGFSRVFKVVFDLIAIKFLARFSSKPIYVFGLSGLLLLVAGFLSAGFIVYRKIYLGGQWVSPLLFASVLFFIVGVQIILMGLLAEMITRANFESSDKKPYRVKNRLNC